VGRTRYARSGDLRVAYELRGTWRRKPWLVLIQGLGMDRQGWGPALRGLVSRFRLVLVDNRGSGASDPATDRFTVADMARDVVAVLDATGIARTHVLGASLGGMVAQEVAIGYPDRVGALVLACTTPGWPYGYPMPAPSLALMSATRRLPPDVAMVRHVENALSPATVRDRPGLVRRLVAHQEAHRGDPGSWYAQFSAGARYAGNLRQKRITAPTLVLHGTADRVVDPQNARLLASRIPDARLVLLPDLGHLFFWEDPAAFVEEVTGFVGGRAATEIGGHHWAEGTGAGRDEAMPEFARAVPTRRRRRWRR
jgi:pimeloyl-ACP methyl ester carboxylesterase